MKKWQLGPFQRYKSNPVLGPVVNPELNSKNVYNPTAYADGNKVYLFARCQDKNMTSTICKAESTNGTSFSTDTEPVINPTEDYEIPGGCEDPRLVVIDGMAYMTYTGFSGTNDLIPRLCLATTKDLTHWRDWTKHGIIAPKNEHWDKAGEIVPYKIDGKFWMHHGEKGIKLAYSDDGIKWHSYNTSVIVPTRSGHFDSVVCEVGSSIVTDDGLLMIYNGADSKKHYCIGEVLFDKDKPWEVLDRCDSPSLHPESPKEKDGEVNNVVFGEGLVKFKNRWILYYGMADRRIGAAFADVK